jgi:D-lyxose ketol-isomerase
LLRPGCKDGWRLAQARKLDIVNLAMQTSPLAAPTALSESRENLRRALINESVATAREVVAALHTHLPPFANWTLGQWEQAGDEMQEVRDVMLGWDVTDFGSGHFHEIGRTLFTLRNGKAGDARYPKPYAEKLLIEPEGQRSPMHYHRSKREDIINRGGGNVIIILHPVGEDGRPAACMMTAQVDGVRRSMRAGDPIRLGPGESLSIPPRTFHQFWAEEGTGTLINGSRYTLSNEVSSICDDWSDNVFVDAWACRFPEISEDEPRACYLCHEYPAPPSGGVSSESAT